MATGALNLGAATSSGGLQMNPTPVGSYQGIFNIPGFSPDFNLASAYQSALPQQAYASTGPTSLNLNGALSSGGLSVAPTTSPTTSPTSPTAPTGGGTGGSNPPAQKTTNNGGNNGGNTSGLPTIDDLISGQMGFLEGLKPQITQQRDQENSAIDTQYGGQKQNISDQLTNLNNKLGIDTNNFNYGMNSAYSQAQNAYNQLLQRNLALYGGGSSAGPAIAAILGQGYQQQGGQLQNQDLSGHQQLGQQGQDITTWGNTQMNTLNNWKDQAHLTINNLAQQGLDQINAAEGATQDQKTADKMQLLQNIINMRQAVQDYHTQLATKIAAIQAMQSPSQYGVTSYDPGNYAAIMSTLDSQVAQTPLTLQNQMAGSAGLNPQQTAQFVGGLFNPGYTNSNNTQDQMLGMLGGGFVPGNNNQQQF